jgi:hypothetical protein
MIQQNGYPSSRHGGAQDARQASLDRGNEMLREATAVAGTALRLALTTRSLL